MRKRIVVTPVLMLILLGLGPLARPILAETVQSTLIQIVPPGSIDYGFHPSLSAYLLATTGAPVADAPVVFTLRTPDRGEIRLGGTKTDAAGLATIVMNRELQPGAYTLVVTYEGSSRLSLRAASASVPLAVAAPAIPTTTTWLAFDLAPPVETARQLVGVRLFDSAGRGIAGATIELTIEGVASVSLKTNNQGLAVFVFSDTVPEGWYQLTATFRGAPEKGLLGASVSDAAVLTTHMGDTTPGRRAVTALRITQPVEGVAGERLNLQAQVLDSAGRPVADVPVEFTLDGARVGRARSDAEGLATVEHVSSLPAGTYTVAASVALSGSSEQAIATSKVFPVSPAEMRIASVPPLPGIRVRVLPSSPDVPAPAGGPMYVTDASGRVHIPLDTTADYQVEVLPWESEDGRARAEFTIWWDNLADAARVVPFRKAGEVQFGLNVSYLVTHRFEDLEGNPVDHSVVSQLKVKSSLGNLDEFAVGEARWVLGNRIIRTSEGLAPTPTLYSVDTALVRGANLVNRSEHRFFALETQDWVISLQYRAIVFRSRDALFGFPIGSAIRIKFPDGSIEEHTLDGSSELTLSSIPRGNYEVQVRAWGLPFWRPLALTRDQTIEVEVFSYFDISVVIGSVTALVVGLWVWGHRSTQRRNRERKEAGPRIGAKVDERP